MIIIHRFYICLAYVVFSNLHQSYPQHHPSRERSVNAKTFYHTSVVPGLSGARAMVRRLLFCEYNRAEIWRRCSS